MLLCARRICASTETYKYLAWNQIWLFCQLLSVRRFCCMTFHARYFDAASFWMGNYI